jgi:hypothetical protein
MMETATRSALAEDPPAAGYQALKHVAICRGRTSGIARRVNEGGDVSLLAIAIRLHSGSRARFPPWRRSAIGYE